VVETLLSVPFTMATSLWEAKIFFVLFYFSSDVWRENSKPVISFIRFLVVVIKRDCDLYPKWIGLPKINWLMSVFAVALKTVSAEVFLH
jgi:hypothetical protein